MCTCVFVDERVECIGSSLIMKCIARCGSFFFIGAAAARGVALGVTACSAFVEWFYWLEDVGDTARANKEDLLFNVIYTRVYCKLILFLSLRLLTYLLLII